MTDPVWGMELLGLHVYSDAVVGKVLAGDASVAAAFASTSAAATTVSTVAGGTIPGLIGGLTPHTWVADTSGLYHTGNLAQEWQAFYKTMLEGRADTLTPWQRLEGNAEAVFESTALAQKSAPIQQRDREDVQRQIDAIAAGEAVDQAVYGIDPNQQLTAQTYLQLEHTMQSSPVLQELGYQGHGLNNSGIAKYRGYTNDFQNGVDRVTLYIGGGLDSGQNALTDFFDDVVLSHLAFPTVWQNGHLEQLNQNANAEDRLAAAVTAFDDAAYNRVFVRSDFSPNPNASFEVIAVPHAVIGSGAALGTITAGAATTVWGTAEVATISGITPHTWKADTATGLYHTGNLAQEWQNAYQTMLRGDGASLTWWQRLEGNAEAVFENTTLAGKHADVLQRDREDVQRQIDAEVAAWKIGLAAGVIAPGELTVASYTQIDHILIGSATLDELATQGHGLNSPPVAKYQGYTNHFQNNVDKLTYYVGGGLDNGENALRNFFDDVVLGHLPYPEVMKNGKFVQLNQNGAREDLVSVSVAALNDAMFHRVYVAADFSASATATGPELTLDTVAAYIKKVQR